LRKACESLLGGEPVVERWYAYEPGGERRGTLRVRVGDVTAYATQRKDGRTTAKEARVLSVLSARDGPVPAFLGFEHGWLLAADAGKLRLSQRLAEADEEQGQALLDSAVATLQEIQRIGTEEDLADVAIPFARGPQVAEHLAGLPESVGARLGLPAPAFDREVVQELLATAGEAFVKWDARPANATVPGSAVVWHDFQHCNRRWPADDFVWLLCDETMPGVLRPARRLAALASEHDSDDAWAPGSDGDTYVAALGVAHVLTRLTAQLDAQDRGVETTWMESLEQDWNGAPKAVTRLLRRGAAVSALSAATAPLDPWFRELQERRQADKR
jgi:hypothetical protein